MAFLTNYTFSQLSKSIDHVNGIDMQLFIESVWDDERIAYILNRYEREYLFNYVNLLKDAEGFAKEWFEEVAEHKDSKKYVFEKNYKSKYHLNQDCKFMQKDFIGYIIPEDIRAMGDDAIFEYRDWFKKENFIEKINLLDQSQLVMRFNSKYPVKYPGKVKPLNSAYKLIDHFENSQTREEDESIDLDKLKNELNLLIYDYKLHFQCPVTRKIGKWHGLIKEPDSEIENKIIELFSEEFLQGYGIEKIKEKLTRHRTISRGIVKNLLDHFKWTYGLASKDFNKVTLENFGLVCCQHCVNQDN